MKKSLVIQAKFIEEWKTPDEKIFYIFGVAFKNKDAGRYYSTTKDQSVFAAGIEAEYEIDINKEKPKESKIRVPKKASNNNYEKLGLDEYLKRKIIDTVTYSARYATDRCIADTNIVFEIEADKILAWQLQQFKDLK